MFSVILSSLFACLIVFVLFYPDHCIAILHTEKKINPKTNKDDYFQWWEKDSWRCGIIFSLIFARKRKYKNIIHAIIEIKKTGIKNGNFLNDWLKENNYPNYK